MYLKRLLSLTFATTMIFFGFALFAFQMDFPFISGLIILLTCINLFAVTICYKNAKKYNQIKDKSKSIV